MMTESELLYPCATFYNHRGLENQYIENTLNAFIHSNLQGIECDVRLTKDRRIVVHHDDNLKRIYKIDQEISKTRLDNLKLLTENSLLQLFEVISLAQKLGKKLIIDIKETLPKNIEFVILFTKRYCQLISFQLMNVTFLSWTLFHVSILGVSVLYATESCSLTSEERLYIDSNNFDGMCLHYDGVNKGFQKFNSLGYIVNIYVKEKHLATLNKNDISSMLVTVMCD